MTQATQTQEKGILLSEAALKHLTMLKEQQGKDLCLRKKSNLNVAQVNFICHA